MGHTVNQAHACASGELHIYNIYIYLYIRDIYRYIYIYTLHNIYIYKNNTLYTNRYRIYLYIYLSVIYLKMYNLFFMLHIYIYNRMAFRQLCSLRIVYWPRPPTAPFHLQAEKETSEVWFPGTVSPNSRRAVRNAKHFFFESEGM